MNLTFEKYRAIDIAIFTALVIVFESICVLAFKSWFKGELYTVSIVLAVFAITMMRWGGLSIIHLVIGSLTTVIVNRLTGGIPNFGETLAVYGIGNLFGFAILAFVKAVGKEKIASSPFISLLYVCAIYVLMQVGKFVVALVFENGKVSILPYLLGEVISLIFAIVVVLLVRRLDGVFEDQKTYLLRLEKQKTDGNK